MRNTKIKKTVLCWGMFAEQTYFQHNTTQWKNDLVRANRHLFQKQRRKLNNFTIVTDLQLLSLPHPNCSTQIFLDFLHYYSSCLLYSSNFGNPFFQVLNVSTTLFSLTSSGTAFSKFHLHGQLREVKLLALLPKLRSRSRMCAIQRAGSSWEGHSQGIAVGEER